MATAIELAVVKQREFAQHELHCPPISSDSEDRHGTRRALTGKEQVVNGRQMQAIVGLGVLVVTTVAVQQVAAHEGRVLGLSSQQTIWVLDANALVVTGLLVKRP